VSFCKQCRERAQAFVKKVDIKKVAAKPGAVMGAICMLCGASIGPSASAEGQEPVQPAYAEYSAMWKFTPLSQASLAELAAQWAGGIPVHQMFLPTDRGDSEPPHPAEPGQTLPGSAATYSGTAPTFAVDSFLPQPGTVPHGGGAISTIPVSVWTSRDWAPFATGQSLAPVLADLPEHAPLQQLPPVIRMPAESRALPANLRANRSQRRNHGRRSS